MDTVRKINDELAIAGQVRLEQLPEIDRAGFKSVLNLRSPDEAGFLNNEQQQAEVLGLSYINIPVEFEGINDESVTQLFNQINKLPKPVLVHCDSAMRAAAIVLLHIAVRQGATLKQAFKRAEKLGLFAINTYN